jgi:hypothetical protein
MAFDAHKNFAVSSVAVAPSPAASGTSLTVATGEGARFPAAPFNGTVCPAQALATPANAEIVRVTAIAGDVLTIVRAQEGTTARAIAIGDLIAATITAKTVTDLESGTNFPQLATPGALTVGGGAAGNAWIRTDTSPGADTKNLNLYGGGGTPSLTYGGLILVSGKEASGGGGVSLYGATGVGPITFSPGGLFAGRMQPSGGFRWGDDNADPGANNVGVKGSVAVGAGAPAQNGAIRLENANAGAWRGVVSARNQANTADVVMMYVDPANGVILGQSPAAVLNLNASGSINSSTQPRASATRSATQQSVPNASWIYFTFDTEVFDVGNCFSLGSPTALYVPTGGAGLYLLMGAVTFDANSTGARYLQIQRNGGGLQMLSGTPLVGDVTTMPISLLASLNAGDAIQLAAFQGSGVALNCTGTLSMVKLW